MTSEASWSPAAVAQTCSALSHQALDIMWELVEDPRTAAGVKRSLLDQMAAHPQDSGRALLEHLKAVRGPRPPVPPPGETARLAQ